MEKGLVCIGTSAGGLDALKILLSDLANPFPWPVVVVQHVSPSHPSYLAEILQRETHQAVIEAEEKQVLQAGVVYTAPSNYHLLVELDGTLSLTVDHKVSYARPSIDILFETVADAFGPGAIAVILTGANHDGAQGAKTIKRNGGIVCVQDPSSAYAMEMPKAALDAVGEPDCVCSIEKMGEAINQLVVSRNVDLGDSNVK